MQSKISDSICVVVPVYNSEKTLLKLVDKLKEVILQFEGYSIILVDDNSIDDSFIKINKLCEDDTNIVGVKLKHNYGQQNAIMCGLQYSNSDYTVIIDDDLEQNPKDVLRLYNEIIKGYDVVYGIIADDRRNTTRDFGSKMRDFLFKTLTNIPRNIKVSSFRIMNHKILKRVVKYDTKFVYISLEILKHTNNIANIYIEKYKKSVSNYNLKKLVSLYVKMIVNYSNLKGFYKWRKLGKCYEIDKVLNGEIL